MTKCLCNICDKSKDKSSLKTIQLQITSFAIEEYLVCDNCMSNVVNYIAFLRKERRKMRIETKLEKVKSALMENKDIEKIEIEPKDHPFLTSSIRIYYKSGLMEIYHPSYYFSPITFIRNYFRYYEEEGKAKNEYWKKRKEVGKDD